MGNFKYPPCSVNPFTEAPYSRHKWALRKALRVKTGASGEPIYYYRFVCGRCGFNDPKSPTH